MLPLPRLRRLRSPRRGGLALAALAGALLLSPGQARAEGDAEVGAFLGAHIFSENNEIGVADRSSATSPSNSFVAGLRLGWAFTPLFSIEGEAAFMPTGPRDGSADLLLLAYRIQAIAHFVPAESRVRPFALVGTGGMTSISSNEDVLYNDADWVVVHGGLGLKYRIGDDWGIRADARVLLPPSSATESVTTDFEGVVGLYKTFGKKSEPIVPPPPPATPTDSDADGITDDLDRCPQEPEDADGFEDEDGCPDTDNDGDGIPDADDQCPDQPESKNNVDDADGCPEDDADGDGLIGSQDSCPDAAEDMDGFEDEDGCPDTDNDGDGIADDADKCPNEAETQNGYEDDDGCPDVVPQKVAKFTGTIKGITFRLGSAEILRGSFEVLDEAVKVLEEYPNVKLEIGGHTDTTGSEDRNKELSQARANAVKAYLVRKGVSEDRLTSVGYGQDQPIADNATKEGRRQNRRVEFKLVQ